MYLLDTNTCIYLIKKKPFSVLRKLQSKRILDVAVSAITVAELQYGVAKSIHQEKNQWALYQFLAPLEIVPFDEQVASHYGTLRASLEGKGKVIGSLDMMIAAHCLSLRAILVTNNEKEFSRIEGLNIENWVTP